MDRERSNKHDQERELERNGYSIVQNNSHARDVEPASFTFPATVPTTLSQIDNFIRSDVVTQIVAKRVAEELENPNLLEVMVNSPEFQQALIRAFSSPQGLEILKKIVAQSAPSVVLANQNGVNNNTHVPMHIDNHQQPAAIEVVSWNVLAPCFALPKFYGYCNQETLNANVRFQKIFDILFKLKPDVICLQEMEAHLHASLAQLLQDYKGTFAGHEGKQDGCSLFIKNSLGEVEFGSLKLSQNKSAATAYVKNYGLWVCSVHLTGDPKQVQTRLTEIQRAREVSQREPILIAGDFNEEEHGSAYSHLQSTGLTSACKQIYGREPLRTFKTDKLDRAIDFIFSSPHFKAVGFECQDIPTSARLPNEKVPSDHVFLRAKLAFTK